MTAVCTTYILMAPEGLALPEVWAYAIAAVVVLFVFGLFLYWKKRKAVSTLG